METELIGVSPNIQKIKKIISQVADSELDILVCGETGVGKDLVVQSLYQKSKRVGRSFVKVNCAALPDTLLESEMFGYERGAFTGAQRRMRGKFEQADRGVLFLDEIGDMSLALQSKLLHALQDKDFTPLGSEKSVKTDVWVIAATNHKLEDDIAKGQFRADLYHRLNTIRIQIEPLRNRPEDIPYLIDYYTKRYASQFNGNRAQTLSKDTIGKLTAYHWPGNVRELQNILKKGAIFGDVDENIDDMLRSAHVKNTATNEDPLKHILFMNNFELGNHNEKQSIRHFSLKDIRKKARDQIDKEVISYVLRKTHWNRSTASRILEISYKTMLTKIQDLKIKRPALHD